MSDQGNIELTYMIEDEGVGVEAVAVTSRGFRHKEIGCQDSSIVYLTPGGRFCALLCSDGHSSAKYGRDGADGICKVICGILDRFEEKNALEEDVVRYFRGRYGRRAILRDWLKYVGDIEETRPEEERYTGNQEIARAYGATLNAFVLTENYIVSISVGDGALAGVRSDGSFRPIFVDEEDGVSTGRTLSLCNLNSEFLNIAVDAKSEFRHLIALTDGYTKTYDLFEKDGVLSQIADIYRESGWEQTKRDILDFMRSDDIVRINDDVSLMFAAVSGGRKEACSQVVVEAGRSLYYGNFTAVFSQMGEAEVGAYAVLSEEDLFAAARAVITAVEELDSQEILITNPVDEALLFDQEHQKFYVEQGLLYEQDMEQEEKNIRLHPELCVGFDRGNPRFNHIYLAGVLFKLFERERLLPFLLYEEWKNKKELDFVPEKAVYLDEETLDYLKLLYKGDCGQEEIWSPEKWNQKLFQLEKEKKQERAELEKRRKEEQAAQAREKYREEQAALAEDYKRYENEKAQLEADQKELWEKQEKLERERRDIEEQRIRLEKKEKELSEKSRELEKKEKELSEKKNLLLSQAENLPGQQSEDGRKSGDGKGPGNTGDDEADSETEQNVRENPEKRNADITKEIWGKVFSIQSPQEEKQLYFGENTAYWRDFGMLPREREEAFFIKISPEGIEVARWQQTGGKEERRERLVPVLSKLRGKNGVEETFPIGDFKFCIQERKE